MVEKSSANHPSFVTPTKSSSAQLFISRPAGHQAVVSQIDLRSHKSLHSTISEESPINRLTVGTDSCLSRNRTRYTEAPFYAPQADLEQDQPSLESMFEDTSVQPPSTPSPVLRHHSPIDFTLPSTVHTYLFMISSSHR